MTPETEAELLQKVGSIDANVGTLLEKYGGHEKRLRAVEKHQWAQWGMLTAVAALVMPKLKAVLGL